MERYLECIGDDPARTLDLLAPGFHVYHGLRVDRLEGLFWGFGGAPNPKGRSPELPLAGMEALDRGRVAWLFVVRHGAYRDLVGRLETTWVGESRGGREVVVTMRLRESEEPPLQQRFHLERADAGSRWKIVAIEQDGVTPENASTAFAAFPSLRNIGRWKAPRRQRSAGEQR